MKKYRIIQFIFVYLITTTILVGCIPEEYTEGVKLHSVYPENDIPIMDDAIIYYCDEDDDNITIRYGVEEDLDDVADFYKDHFEENNILIDDETDKRSKYSAQGSYMGFAFKVKVSEPSSDYEEKVFNTIVKVDIAFADDSLGTITQLQEKNPVSKRILGFWRQESFEDDKGKKQESYDYGSAYEFLPDGTLNLYFNYVLILSGKWEELDESTVLFTPSNQEPRNITVTLEKRSKNDYLIWEDSSGILTFFKDSSDDFTTQSIETNSDEFTPDTPDKQLTHAISDTTWYYIKYSDEDGVSYDSYDGQIIYHSNGTFEDTLDGETRTGNWYVSAGWLYCESDDDEDIEVEIGVKYRGSANYLFFYSSENPGAYWQYSNFPKDSIITYTTNEDMANAISDKDFYRLYYMYSDGKTLSSVENDYSFNADSTFEDLYKGELFLGEWFFHDGYLNNAYDNGDNFYYPAIVEYNKVLDAYYLFLGDLEEGYEECYWVYTTYQP